MREPRPLGVVEDALLHPGLHLLLSCLVEVGEAGHHRIVEDRVEADPVGLHQVTDHQTGGFGVHLGSVAESGVEAQLPTRNTAHPGRSTLGGPWRSSPGPPHPPTSTSCGRCTMPRTATWPSGNSGRGTRPSRTAVSWRSGRPRRMPSWCVTVRHAATCAWRIGRTASRCVKSSSLLRFKGAALGRSCCSRSSSGRASDGCRCAWARCTSIARRVAGVPGGDGQLALHLLPDATQAQIAQRLGCA